MKSKILSLFAFALFVLAQVTASECHAQEKYFRYFEVHSPSFSETELNSVKAKLEKQEFMALYASCPTVNKLVVAVDASYPKRIQAIEKEIIEMVAGKNARRQEAVLIKSVAASERNQICQ